VLTLLTEGLGSGDIAERLALSEDGPEPRL
jgi:DNA-binding NarL/FixJ family response regulator